MDKVEQRAWELLEAECGKPLPFDVPTHAALSAVVAALTVAQQPAAEDWGLKTCYQCNRPVTWLAPDSRCVDCTRLTPDEVGG